MNFEMSENETNNYKLTNDIEIEVFSTSQGQTSCLTEPTVPGALFPGREADHSPLSGAEVKNGGAIPPLPILLHDLVMN
jgi:hypothetical protein